jgi:DNA-binding NarL/FixJ family response regulator
MALETVERTSILRVALIGCDYLTTLGLSLVLEGCSFLNVVGEVPTVRDAVSLAENSHFDLVLIDAGLGSGELIRSCEALAGFRTPPRVVVLGDIDLVLSEQLLVAGATGIIGRTGITEDFGAVLRVIHQGKTLVSSAQVHGSLRSRNRQESQKCRDFYERLSVRERTVADGVAQGFSNVEIALKLHLSETSIKQIVSKIMAKVGACNRVQIAVVVTKALSS